VRELPQRKNSSYVAQPGRKKVQSKEHHHHSFGKIMERPTTPPKGRPDIRERPNVRTYCNVHLPPLLRIATRKSAESARDYVCVLWFGFPGALQGLLFTGGFRVSAFHGCGGVEFAPATTIEVLLSAVYEFAGVRSRSRLAGERESSEPRREPSPWKRSTRKVSLCLTFSVAVQQ